MTWNRAKFYMQAKRKSGNSCAENFVSLYHRIQSSEWKYVKVSKSLFILSLEYGKVKLLTRFFVHNLYICSLFNTQVSSFSPQLFNLYPHTDIQKDKHKTWIYLLGLLKSILKVWILRIHHLKTHIVCFLCIFIADRRNIYSNAYYWI